MMLKHYFAYITLLYLMPGWASGEARPTLTVFVHGTVGWYLAALSPSWFSHGNIQDDMYYYHAAREVRKDTHLFEHHLMLDEGFVEIPETLIDAAREGTLTREQERRGSYFIISAYDAIAEKVGLKNPGDRYALFGWSGLNAQSERQQAGHQLYDSLCSWRDDYKRQYNVTPHINIIAYSHGGGVALFLAHAEKKHRKGLHINLLALFGTPLQVETQHFLIDDMFKSIILLRSTGDSIQTLDSFSTVIGESFSRMRYLINLGLLKTRKPLLYRADIELDINNNGDIIDHFNLFTMDHSPLHAQIDPLPLVVLAPAIIQGLLEHQVYSAVRARIVCADNLVHIRLKSGHAYDALPIYESDNLHETIKHHRRLVHHYWWPIKKQKQGFWKEISA